MIRTNDSKSIAHRIIISLTQRFLKEVQNFIQVDATPEESAFAASKNPQPDWLNRQGVEALTDREQQILELIAQGLSNTQISEQLVLSPKTVKNHITHIFSKMQVKSRAAAIVQAREAGFGTPKELQS
ncbi:response regulator transcription factor [Egbenema bharatensis]|uniref:response regulator transcription factor n=1 Tax=Egbenema bharatensis TaxID=3463334 RepID=UPI003A89B9A8